MNERHHAEPRPKLRTARLHDLIEQALRRPAHNPKVLRPHVATEYFERGQSDIAAQLTIRTRGLGA